ncbi:MAG: FkbM family methyltransferase [Opitutaceae bacterium]|nr:FkbM family methyltransferase [Opitutaceae bacterium]
MKSLLRQWAERLSGTRIFRRLPLGIDEFVDIKAAFPRHPFACFVDVGANVGQTARQIRRHFPQAEIHAIEPIADTFSRLRENTRDMGIKVHQLALGAANGEAEVAGPLSGVDSVMNSLAARNPAAPAGGSSTKAECVAVRTLETFCEESGITGIDYLKIDTEGFDLQVLKGAGAWIDEQRIPLVMAEVSMNPTNAFHVPFEEVKRHMEGRGYLVFALYEQTQEWKLKQPVLRRANVLFVSRRMAGVSSWSQGTLRSEACR